LFLISRKYEPGCSSRIPDPGDKKAPDPGSGTLHTTHLAKIKTISQKHEEPTTCAWLPHLVVETELQLGVHGADLDGEDLAGLLPPEEAHLLVHG
jgi:hypothetical protein